MYRRRQEAREAADALLIFAPAKVEAGDFIAWHPDLKAPLNNSAGCHRRPDHLHRRQFRCCWPVAPATGSPMPPCGSPDQDGMSPPIRLRSARFECLGATDLTRRLMEASAAATVMEEASSSR